MRHVVNEMRSIEVHSNNVFFFFFEVLVYCPVGSGPLVGHLHVAGYLVGTTCLCDLI